MKPVPMLSTIAVGEPVVKAEGLTLTTTVNGIIGYVDRYVGAAIRMPWSATFHAGELREGWLGGPLVDVWTARRERVPADLVRSIERVARAATGGDNLPRIEIHPDAHAYTETTRAPKNVIRLNPRVEPLLSTAPKRVGHNPPDRRLPDAD